MEFVSSSTDGSELKKTQVKGPRGQVEELPLYKNKDTVKGFVKVIPIPGKRVEHVGIRVQLVGEIVMASDESHPHEILSLVRDLAPPGEMMSQETYPFEFKSVEMEYDSYRGTRVKLRYAVRVIVARSMGQSLIQDYYFEVQNPIDQIPEGLGDPIKVGFRVCFACCVWMFILVCVCVQMEVGIEDCLHIEFEYGRDSYHLNDTVIGKINFLLVRIKLKHMELEIKRRETVGGGMNARLESTTVAKFEIMDGAPARGESIPIRLYLSPYALTPTYENVHNKFGVKYSINLVLVDEEDRRYFKQQDIKLYRLESMAASASWDLISGSMTHYLDHVPGVSPREATSTPEQERLEKEEEEESLPQEERIEKEEGPPEDEDTEKQHKNIKDDKDDHVKESVEEESKGEGKPSEIVFGEAMSSDDECIEEVDLGSP